MTADTAIFLQSALKLPEYLKNTKTNDKWRIFSKLGLCFKSLFLKYILSVFYRVLL
jgi:hypothetical protein